MRLKAWHESHTQIESVTTSTTSVCGHKGAPTRIGYEGTSHYLPSICSLPSTVPLPEEQRHARAHLNIGRHCLLHLYRGSASPNNPCPAPRASTMQGKKEKSSPARDRRKKMLRYNRASFCGSRNVGHTAYRSRKRIHMSCSPPIPLEGIGQRRHELGARTHVYWPSCKSATPSQGWRPEFRRCLRKIRQGKKHGEHWVRRRHW
jgi:hypothetical protein